MRIIFAQSIFALNQYGSKIKLGEDQIDDNVEVLCNEYLKSVGFRLDFINIDNFSKIKLVCQHLKRKVNAINGLKNQTLGDYMNEIYEELKRFDFIDLNREKINKIIEKLKDVFAY